MHQTFCYKSSQARISFPCSSTQEANICSKLALKIPGTGQRPCMLIICLYYWLYLKVIREIESI